MCFFEGRTKFVANQQTLDESTTGGEKQSGEWMSGESSDSKRETDSFFG
jgi:hypothetical protein